MDDAAVIVTFLKRYLDDREAGRVSSLQQYKSLFPGYEDLIAEEFAAIERGDLSDGPARAEREERVRLVAGRYRILEELARGGQGEVYLAEDERLHRKVALKVIRGLGTLPTDLMRRFRREAEVASRLEHPGLCTVHDSGLENGLAYIAMQYVEGRSLAQVIRDRRKPDATASTSRAQTLEAASMIEKVARALHLAHEAGIVHRDIKPSNIMVTPQGEPVILDFGLASDLTGDEPTLTKTGDMFGTPAYMSPEQLTGASIRLDRRTDVWSLGVTLYECLGLRLPFEAPTREGLYQAILTREPPDPRELNPALPGDLKTVLGAALEKDRDRRYQTALDLAEDLRRVCRHEPILAKPVGRLLRLRRWSQRNPALATALTALFVVLATGCTIALMLLADTRRERDDKQATLSDYDRLGDLPRLQRLVAEADTLWPAEPAKVGPMKTWLDHASDLEKRLAGHQAVLDRLRKSALASEDGLSWKFEVLADQFKHDTTAKLVADLSAFVDADPKKGLLSDVRSRLAFAELVQQETIGKHETEWAAAIRSIADQAECPKYQGLRIRPQLGLIPIGKDPASGLWEFAHLQTTAPGADPIPAREKDGRFVVTEPMGLVFVLIPGGTFRMGAIKPDEDQMPSDPNIDSDADGLEAPVTEVALDPFFMSKYEMTQGQWQRLVGKNPSQYGPRTAFAGKMVSLLNPVEQVSWKDCDSWLGRLGLILPTEAQWEYAARGGTTTPRWTGPGKDGLSQAANVSDARSHSGGAPAALPYESWDDGYVIHAPVASFAANPFGLHDVLGNVWEWCRDWCCGYEVAVDPRDGQRQSASETLRVYRGGSYGDTAAQVRSAFRGHNSPENCGNICGVRPARSVDR